jgi:hypothetical protein
VGRGDEEGLVREGVGEGAEAEARVLVSAALLGLEGGVLSVAPPEAVAEGPGEVGLGVVDQLGADAHAAVAGAELVAGVDAVALVAEEVAVDLDGDQAGLLDDAHGGVDREVLGQRAGGVEDLVEGVVVVARRGQVEDEAARRRDEVGVVDGVDDDGDLAVAHHDVAHRAEGLDAPRDLAALGHHEDLEGVVVTLERHLLAGGGDLAAFFAAETAFGLAAGQETEADEGDDNTQKPHGRKLHRTGDRRRGARCFIKVRIAPAPLFLRASFALALVGASAWFAPELPRGELRVYRLEDEGVTRLVSGQRVCAGDVLQAAYAGPAGERAWVYSRDGLGHVTLHAAASAGGRWRMAPRAFVLDDAPGCEDFAVFVGDDPAAFRARLARTKCGAGVSGAVVVKLRR